MRESGLSPKPVILDSRLQRFASRLANACSSNLKELYKDPSSGTPICQVDKIEPEHHWTTKSMRWPALGNEPVIKSLKPLYWMTKAQPRKPRNAVQERWKPKSERASGCGEQMDHAQMMAKWEPQQCANIEINGGRAAATIWVLDTWRNSTPSFG